MSFGKMIVTTKGALVSAKTLQEKVLKFVNVEIRKWSIDWKCSR